LTGSVVLRLGDRGNAVRDLSTRISASLGTGAGAKDVFDNALQEAVRAFQEQRGLRVDGICGPETWGALIESGFQLGDRLLYLSSPMLRGDDVAELQRRLNLLGFDAGREDGILGPETEDALRQFQRNAGTTADGVCGPESLAALSRVSGLAAGSVASVREREGLRRESRRLDGLRVFLVAEPAMGALAGAVTGALRNLGGLVGADTSGEDPSVLTTEANRFRAGAFVALTNSGEPGVRCAYFSSGTFRSEAGLCLASALTESLRQVCADVDDPIGRTYRFLRETRMPAVVCELVGRDDADARSMLTTRLPEMTRALVEGFRRGLEEPRVDEQPERDL
jgi:N-acetylmuramoyl-L-alanine amidase